MYQSFAQRVAQVSQEKHAGYHLSTTVQIGSTTFIVPGLVEFYTQKNYDGKAHKVEDKPGFYSTLQISAQINEALRTEIETALNSASAEVAITLTYNATNPLDAAKSEPVGEIQFNGKAVMGANVAAPAFIGETAPTMKLDGATIPA